MRNIQKINTIIVNINNNIEQTGRSKLKGLGYRVENSRKGGQGEQRDIFDFPLFRFLFIFGWFQQQIQGLQT